MFVKKIFVIPFRATKITKVFYLESFKLHLCYWQYSTPDVFPVLRIWLAVFLLIFPYKIL